MQSKPCWHLQNNRGQHVAHRLPVGSCCDMRHVTCRMSVLPALQVLEEAMRTFDKNGDGLIQYQEFVSTLFPNLAKGFRQ